MKKSIVLLIFLITLFSSGCAQKKRVYLRRPSKKAVPVAKAEVKAPEAVPAAKETPLVVYEEKAPGEYVEYKSAPDLFFSAVENYENEKYDTSFLLFDQLLKSFPGDSLIEDSLIYKARMLFIKQFYDRASTIYESVLRDFTETRFKEEAMFYLYISYRELNQEDKMLAQREAFLAEFPESPYMAEIDLEKADEYFDASDFLNAFTHYVKFYMVSDDEEAKAEVRRVAIDIVENILDHEELESIANNYFDKFPAAYIKLSLARSYLLMRDTESVKYTLLEIQEFFPLFEKYDYVQEMLDNIKIRVKTKPNVIVCLLPLSGRYEAYGKRLLAGIMLAADVFSAEEIEMPITIMVKDTKGDPETALMLLDEAYSEDQAIAVIGPLLSKNAQICAKRADELKLPIMLLTQKENIADGYNYVYRKFITNSNQVNSLLDYAMDDMELTRFAIMYPDNTYGKELHELFFEEVARRGGQIVATESYDTKSKDFSKEIKKVVGLDDLEDRKRLREIWVDEVIEEETLDMQFMIDNEGMTQEAVQEYLDSVKKELLEEKYRPIVDFEAIFVPDTYSRAGLIIPQLLYHDIDNDVLKLGTNSYNSKKLIEIAQGNANGIVFVDGFFKDSSAENVKSFVKEYGETFRTTPTLLEAESYDSAKIIIGLIRDNELEGRDELKNELDTLKNYNGVTGLVKSFEGGDVVEDLVLLKIRRQKIRQVTRVKREEPVPVDGDTGDAATNE